MACPLILTDIGYLGVLCTHATSSPLNRLVFLVSTIKLDGEPSMILLHLFWPYMVRWWSWPSNLLTSKSNHFISKCTNVVNLVKFPQAVYEISFSPDGPTHWRTHAWKPENVMPPSPVAFDRRYGWYVYCTAWCKSNWIGKTVRRYQLSQW